MKKILTIATAVLAAGAMHAASLAWGANPTSNSADTIDGGWAQEGTVYNLIYLGMAAPEGTASTYDTSTGLTNLGGTKVATHTLTYDEYYNGAFSGTPYGADESVINGYYMITMFDSTTPTGADSVIFQVSGLTNSGGAGDTRSIAGTDALGNNYGSLSVSSTPVPEPCSIALIFIGVAAVGMKRKIA